jgi:citrate synthase
MAVSGRAAERVRGELTLDEVVADALGILASRVTDELAFRSVPEWDSLRHVELMLALEEHWGRRIDPDLVLSLTSVAAIRAFDRTGEATPPPDPEVTIHRGLGDVHIDETRVSEIDGPGGRLAYRGFGIDELAQHSTFEETAHLLLHGELPNAEELALSREGIHRGWELPAGVVDVLGPLRDAHPLEALRAGVSALGGIDPDRDDRSPDGLLRAGPRLLGSLPAVVAAHHAIRTRRDPTGPPPGDGQADRVLRALTGRDPTPREVRILDRVLILMAEHGSNASAFAARVVIGTGGGLHAAVTAALAAFGGPLHGGAIEGVTEMVEAVGDPSRAAEYVRVLRERNEPIIGHGHRLYRTEDPRAEPLRVMARELSEAAGELRPFLILEEVRRAMEPYTRHGIDVNVDFYAGLVLLRLGIPPDLLTAVFAIARTAGWVAQAAEQAANNVLIRPLLRYVGEPARPYVPLARRGPPEFSG